MMRRREFMAALVGPAAVWPFAARAQQPAIPVVGFLNAQKAAGFQHLVAAFQRGLNEVGFVEGQNVAIEYRWADGHIDRLPALADELIRRRGFRGRIPKHAARWAKGATGSVESLIHTSSRSDC